MSILEAMSHGLPVVAPAVGGISEIITHGWDGFCVTGRRPEDFAAVCLDLCANRRLHAEIARRARAKIVRDFSCHSMVQQYIRTYIQMTDGLDRGLAFPEKNGAPTFSHRNSPQHYLAVPFYPPSHLNLYGS
jgi:glycogen synthase